ncbi:MULTISPECIES: hypothetical protein [unclassified Streptomyces]|uniref:hypothetical protein n=1 Tax=unclassified Streptomyces TaxID=2593676 RepID=UPI001655015B|nr:hypothetical protein [Streptomyces sp. CB02980]MCB8901000.1 hypothetical protein [Streptomyces sp. CB02980]
MARTLALVLAGATALAVAPAVAGPEPGRAEAEAAADKAVTYRVTAPYQQHANGVRAGYKPDQYCVFDRAGGTGALGYPHFNHAYDNSTDPAKPTALFYEDDGKGGKRLVGVEWLVHDRDQSLKTDDDRPSMFGVPFKGPNRGNFPGQPLHYALHLWLWKKNPKGQFTTYNPAVTCLPGTTRPQPRPSS